MRPRGYGRPRIYLPRTSVNSIRNPGLDPLLYAGHFVSRASSGQHGPREHTHEPRKPYELAADAAVAGVIGAAIVAAGSYAFLYGLSYQFSPIPGTSINSGAGGTITALFFLLLAVAMSVGGGALLSKALGVSTWQRSTLISAAAHAIGLPLWIWTDLHIVIGLHTPGSTYGFDWLVAF